MAKDDRLYLGHMLDTARDAQELVRGITRKEFDQDKKLRWSLVYLLQTIGESARRVSAATQAAVPSIAWRQIIGMRHHVVHDYLIVDYDVIWDSATSDLPRLIVELEKLVPPTGPLP